MSSSKSSNQSTQQVVTNQSTTVSVQNVIEAPKQTALGRFRELAEIVRVLDAPVETGSGGSAVLIQSPDPLEFLKNPQTLIWIAAGVIGVILIAKKV